MDKSKLTPMLQQYLEIKEKNPDSLLFFRLGDFYEMFFEDAEIASKVLGITLTSRDSGTDERIPMCGIPHHVIDQYLPKLIEHGHIVAICEQLEDPALAKGIVKRGVVKIITPGTYNEHKADERQNNYLVSIFYHPFGSGLSYIDYGTGEVYTTEINNGTKTESTIISELSRLRPSEVLINRDGASLAFELNKWIESRQIQRQIIDFNPEKELSQDEIQQVYATEKFSVKEHYLAASSLTMVINYLKHTQKENVATLKPLAWYDIESYLILDQTARLNLELTETLNTGEKRGSLYGILDKTKTAMGSRLLRQWIEMPLKNINLIEQRLGIVESFFNETLVREETRKQLSGIYDMDRLLMRITTGSAHPKDLLSLKNSLLALPEVVDLLKEGDEKLQQISRDINLLDTLVNLLKASIKEDAPAQTHDGGFIKDGFNEELDHLRELSINGKQWLVDYESKLKDETGIKNLKVKYNKILGYYIDVTKSNLDLVPDHFIRKQTLVGSERFFTEELKDMEDEILNANEKAIRQEKIIYDEIMQKCVSEIPKLQSNSNLIAEIDVFTSLALVAYMKNYVRPQFNTNKEIIIQDGRHPVVEELVSNENFVPNDTHIDTKDRMIQIITGPNMSGKSTYMRQVALIALMAQVGMFVPATFVDTCIIDRIFTRIGATDNLYKGESTFMVEMNEVAQILDEATEDSLIILDEVGRGTSTYDGLSIAWSVILYIQKRLGAKTLFATHYHELTQLQDQENGIINLAVLAKDEGKTINFIRKVKEGYANESYGIQVAQLAGVKDEVIKKAWEILDEIEFTHHSQPSKPRDDNWSLVDYQRQQFIERLSKIDVNNLTPMDAMVEIGRLVNEAKSLGDKHETE